MDIFLAQGLISWYDRINSVRLQEGMGLTELPLPDVKSGTLASASVINTFKEQILEMKSNTYMSYADYTYTENISASSGGLISKGLKDDMESSVVEMEKICPNNITTGDATCTTCETNSTYTNNSTQNVSDDKTCATYSTRTTDKTQNCYTTYQITWGDRTTSPTIRYSTVTDYDTTSNTTNKTCSTDYTRGNTTNSTYTNKSNGCSTQINTTESTNLTNITTSNTTYSVKKS